MNVLKGIKEILTERDKNDKDNKYLDMLIGILDYTEMPFSEIEYIINSKYYSNVFHPRHTEKAMKTIIDQMDANKQKKKMKIKTTKSKHLKKNIMKAHKNLKSKKKVIKKEI